MKFQRLLLQIFVLLVCMWILSISPADEYANDATYVQQETSQTDSSNILGHLDLYISLTSVMNCTPSIWHGL